MARRWMLVVVLLGIVVIAATIRVMLEREVVAPTAIQPERFDAAGWHSSNAWRRIAMARYLTTNQKLIGRPRDELVAMLGPPSDGATDRNVRWFLGERASGASLMFPYLEYLDVSLDKHGVCARAVVITRD